MNANGQLGARAKKPGRPPKGAVRAEQKASTRARVLEVARVMLEERGLEATSIRDVAAAAGVAAGTVLLHFPDKTQLLHAALFEDLERTWATARGSAQRRSLRADGEQLASAFFSYYAARPALSRALLRESLFAESPWRERFAAQVAAVHAHVAELAAGAAARGEIAADTDVAVLGAAFFSFYYFALLAWQQGGHPEPLRLFAKMWGQHLGGVAAPRSKTRRPGRSR